jgi:hypothetical protein
VHVDTRAKLFGTGAALLLVGGLALGACGGPAPAPAVAQPTAASGLASRYPEALNQRNQLMLGTIRLEATGNSVTPEQARRLLPLWQAFKALTAPGSAAAVQETDALLAQIQRGRTAEQTAAIAAMRLTTADLNAYYAELGLPPPPTPAPGTTAQQPGSGASAGLSEVDKQATRTARGVTGTPTGVGRGQALVDNAIALLAARAGACDGGG